MTWALRVKSGPGQGDLWHHYGGLLECEGPVPRQGGGTSHHCPGNQPRPEVGQGSWWLVGADGFRLARSEVVSGTGREGRDPVLGGAAKDCAGGWGLLARKALPSGCSWIGGLTMICCVLPVGPVCPPVTFAPVLLECSDLAWLCVVKGKGELRAQLRAH